MERHMPPAGSQTDSGRVGYAHRASSIVALEKHYSVAELAKLWLLSESTVRRLFINEPGVLKLAHEETRFKRRYTTLRIPERIAQHVHRRLQGAM